jgi:Family of unknown function (DUF6263)
MRTTLFSTVRLALFSASALAVLATTTAQAQTTLRWKFQKGEKLGYVMNQKSVTKMNANNQIIEITTAQVIDTTWVVKDIKTDGLAEVTQSFDRVRFDMDMPGIKVAYDSKDGKLPEGPVGQALGPVLKALAGAEITFNMNGRGEVTDVKVPEQVLTAIKGIQGAGAGGMFSEDGIKKTIMQSTIALPQEPVSRGKNWHQKSEMPTPPIGVTSVDNSYTYQGIDSQGSGRLDRIDVSVDTEIKPDKDAPVQVKLKSQDSKGMLLFDNEKGHLTETTLTQKLEMALTVMGMEITQNQESTSTMKLNKPG